MDTLFSCKLAVQWVRGRNLVAAKIQSQKLAVDQAAVSRGSSTPFKDVKQSKKSNSKR